MRLKEEVLEFLGVGQKNLQWIPVGEAASFRNLRLRPSSVRFCLQHWRSGTEEGEKLVGSKALTHRQFPSQKKPFSEQSSRPR